jgi:hypothetical protein
MTLRGCLPVLLLFTVAFTSFASPVTVNFVAALEEGVGPVPLPVELGGIFNPNNLRLRFEVPNAALIISLNSMTVSVDLFDDGDANPNEEGDLVFVLQSGAGPNFVFGSFGPGLNGYTETSPLTVIGTINPADFPNVLAEIQDDGFFVVRVNRNGGDFSVSSAKAAIDAQLVPEPSAFLLAAGGLAAIKLLRRRK